MKSSFSGTLEPDLKSPGPPALGGSRSSSGSDAIESHFQGQSRRGFPREAPPRTGAPDFWVGLLGGGRRLRLRRERAFGRAFSGREISSGRRLFGRVGTDQPWPWSPLLFEQGVSGLARVWVLGRRRFSPRPPPCLSPRPDRRPMGGDRADDPRCGGRPRTADTREIADAIPYIPRAGGSCRTISRPGGASTTTCAAGGEGAWARIPHRLAMADREREGRDASPRVRHGSADVAGVPEFVASRDLAPRPAPAWPAAGPPA